MSGRAWVIAPLGLALLLVSGLVVLLAAQEPGALETKTGFLIPSQCRPREGVVEKRGDSYDTWPAPHSTACALRPACIESGYGLWEVDRFYRFDQAGQAQALHYFRTTKRTSYNKVNVRGDFADPEAVRVEDIALTD